MVEILSSRVLLYFNYEMREQLRHIIKVSSSSTQQHRKKLLRKRAKRVTKVRKQRSFAIDAYIVNYIHIYNFLKCFIIYLHKNTFNRNKIQNLDIQNLRRRNCCNKEFYLECGSLQIKATAHINKQKIFTVDFKELTSEAYSEPSHTYKLQFFSKIFKTSKTSKLFSTPLSKRFAHKNCEVY